MFPADSFGKARTAFVVASCKSGLLQVTVVQKAARNVAVRMTTSAESHTDAQIQVQKHVPVIIPNAERWGKPDTPGQEPCGEVMYCFALLLFQEADSLRARVAGVPLVPGNHHG